MTTTMTMPARLPVRVEKRLGVEFRIDQTDEADERLRYAATITGLPEPVAGLSVGLVIGWGREPARARRRAVDKIANRRRGPLRPSYTVHGVTFSVGPNTDKQAPKAHAFLAVVTSVDPASAARRMAQQGQVLARKATGAGAADRAYYLLAHMAEQGRADDDQQRLAAQGAQIIAEQAAAAGRWDDAALCRQVDPDAFFPGKGESPTSAQAVCRRCDIRVECLARALDDRIGFGVWGGETETARRKMLRRGITGEWVRRHFGAA